MWQADINTNKDKQAYKQTKRNYKSSCWQLISHICAYNRIQEHFFSFFDIQEFHWIGPTQLTDSVIKLPCPSVCLSVCLFAPSGAVFLGLLLALISHDQFQASHWSSLPPSPLQLSIFIPFGIGASIRIGQDIQCLPNAGFYFIIPGCEKGHIFSLSCTLLHLVIEISKKINFTLITNTLLNNLRLLP